MNSEDKLEVFELLSKAAYGYDARNIDMLSSCFAEDAIMSMRIGDGDIIGPFNGKKEIMSLMTSSMEEQTDKRLHQISNIFVENEEKNRIIIISSLALFSVKDNKVNILTTGIYKDFVEKIKNHWKIKNRHLDLALPY